MLGRTSNCVRPEAYWLAVLLLASAPIASAQEKDGASVLDQIPWQTGPRRAALGLQATIELKAGYRFANRDGARMLMEALENPVSGDELGVVLNPNEGWYVMFEWDECGYVKDDDGRNLDADALLKSIRAGSEAANKERKRRGWSTLEVVGWEQPPHYDTATQNLVWAIRVRSRDGDSVNYNTRRLGRSGVVAVTLVLDPQQLEETVPQFNKLMGGFSFVSGSRYGDFRAGDKVAEYGLTALVAGGAAAVAVKSGLFKYLWKGLVVAVIAIGGAIKAIFGRRRTA